MRSTMRFSLRSPSKPVARSSFRRSLSIRNEISYVMVKPDGVQRKLVGEIISRFESKGYKIKGLKMTQCSRQLAEEHYAELKDRPFFPNLVEYITSGPVVCIALEGKDVVSAARNLIGVTNPVEAAPGSIRGDFGIDKGRNVVHGSDSPENGLREIELWFTPQELVEWDPTMAPWIEE